MKRTWIGFGLACVLGALGCQSAPGEDQESKEAFEARMREIEQRIKDSMPKTQQIALKQKIEPERLKKVQEQLNALKEYLDEPTGKMDFVTVNAVQAFQRRMGLGDDGLLDERTLRLLEQEAAKVGQGNTDDFKTG
ncbi:MAG: peptidoglycan-binding domain-containing protein [Candidatus Binatia bacterium]